jgi:ferredoxin
VTPLRPALLAAYRDLSALRYDYPLVLVESASQSDFARSLSDSIDDVLREVAPPGPAGERMRQHVLRLEARIRARVADGAKGSLDELWKLTAQELCSEPGVEDDGLEDSLRGARAALRVDGDLVDCGEELAPALVQHAWQAVERARSEATLAVLDGLVAKLSDVLAVDFLKSADARSPRRIERSIGAHHAAAFDFGTWSDLLKRPEQRLSSERRQRIQRTLAVLESQRFFARSGPAGGKAGRPEPLGFVFRSCANAAEAFRERSGEMAELVRAMAIAELEIANRYREEVHDELFARFDETWLEPADLARFPSYLVSLPVKEGTAREMTRILELLDSGLPMKVVFRTDDILAVAPGSVAGPGRGSAPLASLAVALGDSYVLQAASSSLFQVRDRIREGLTRSGPALFSVYVGSAEQAPELPPYLRAATAMQSRAFPTFSYDPAAGGDWTARFRLEDNPQPEKDWPIDRLEYEGESLRRSGEDVAFTFVDFASCDRRCEGYFRRVARSDWDESLVPVSTHLAPAEDETPGGRPYVWLADEQDVLHRYVVDRMLIRAARRCRERWRGLQELCGVRDERLRHRLEQERAAWERERAEASAVPEPRSTQAAPDPAAQAGAPGDVEPEGDPDQAYIETTRCTTCDECTQRNPKMFAYDENKQAYIADLDAGTYRDLVEAAESCQVSIIHPGKPRNPQEPGLAELLERAQPFL